MPFWSFYLSFIRNTCRFKKKLTIKKAGISKNAIYPYTSSEVFMSNVKVLVTGGAGFIGSHLVDRLSLLGFELVVVDNLTSGYRDNIESSLCFYDIPVLSLPNK